MIVRQKRCACNFDRVADSSRCRKFTHSLPSGPPARPSVRERVVLLRLYNVDDLEALQILFHGYDRFQEQNRYASHHLHAATRLYTWYRVPFLVLRRSSTLDLHPLFPSFFGATVCV